MSPGVRTFVAVPLPAEIQSAIQGVAQQMATPLATRLPEVKWSRKAENLHVTLRFLGQVDPALLNRFAAALAAALGSMPEFEIGLRGLGAFPSARDAQVIWVGVDDPSCRLGEVARVVEEVTEQLGLHDPHHDPHHGPHHDPHHDPHDDPRDTKMRDGKPPRAFQAHVTIGRTPRRARGGVDAGAVLDPWSRRSFGRVSIREIHLYESITGGDASTYILRGTAMLKGATHGDRQERDQGNH